jgi:uncharacterized membrane protein (UPF0127 family)
MACRVLVDPPTLLDRRRRMQKPTPGWTRTISLMAVVLAWGCLWACQEDRHEPAKPFQRVTLSGQTFELELALDGESRYQGLSDRDQVPPNGGMLFVFPRPRRMDFVMRRCRVPIDLVFLDPGGRVVATHAMTVEPPQTPENQLRRYTSGYPAQFAIELPGGALAQLNLITGMKVQLPTDALKHRSR